MTKNKIWVLVISIGAFILININSCVNLSLNYTYGVRGFSSIKRIEALKGVENSIEKDYEYSMILLGINSIVLLVLLVIITILYKRTKKSKIIER